MSSPLDDEGGEEGEGWLVSYADMMTLIACFFILMMAFANYDPVGFNQKAEELSKNFRKDKYKSSQYKLTEMTEEVAKHDLKDRLKISMKDSELVVKFSSSILFDNGSSELTQTMLSTLDALIEVVKITNPSYRVLIEGHADDDLKNSPYKTNWELSTMRAAKIAERFSYFGFEANKVVPIGRGSSQPAMEIEEGDPQKEEKRKLNRRIVIRLLEPYQKKKIKFGLGVYFKDATENVDENPLSNQDLDGFEVE